MNDLPNAQLAFRPQFENDEIVVRLTEAKRLIESAREAERRRIVWIVEKELITAQHALGSALANADEEDVITGCRCWVFACQKTLGKIKNNLNS